MIKYRSLRAIVAGSIAALAGCRTAPPPMVVPASFTPLGVNAPYLMGDVIGGLKARQAKMRAARIRPLGPAEAGAYLAGHGVAKPRIASRGLGELAPLYNPETSENQKAANRRIEIRLVPYRG